MPNDRSVTSHRRVVVTGSALLLPARTAERRWLSIRLDPREVLGPDRGRRLDPLSLSSLVAIEAARRQAGLENQRINATVRVAEGVAVGTALGACTTSVRYARRLVQAGPATTNPIDFPDSIDGAPAAHIALELGFGGPCLTFVDGSSSATAALLYAARQIAWGRAERMHVVVGDQFESVLGDAITKEYLVDQRRLGHERIVAECLLALVLEPRPQSPSVTTELVGFLPQRRGPGAEPALPALAPRSEGSTDSNADGTYVEPPVWHLDETESVSLAQRTVVPESQQLWDPSGALALAAAWSAVAGRVDCVVGPGHWTVGATDARSAVAGRVDCAGGVRCLAEPAPLACRVHCGTNDYPDLGFVDLPGP